MTGAADMTVSIDIHAHFFPRSYRDLITEHGAGHGVTCVDEGDGPVIVSEGKRTPPLEARTSTWRRVLPRWMRSGRPSSAETRPGCCNCESGYAMGVGMPAVRPGDVAPDSGESRVRLAILVEGRCVAS